MNPAMLLALLSRFAPLAGVAAVLCMVWLLGPTLAFGDVRPLVESWQRWLATVLILLGAGAWYLVKWALAKKREEKLQQAVAGQEQGARVVENRLKAGFDALKKHQRSAGAMLSMPWYAVIGAPGTGKTTAIRASRLKFVARDVVGAEAYQGVGGTRHCNWWIADEAVLLDTAGRYSYSEAANAADEEEWRHFLATVKRFRPERPVNGVLVFFGLDQIASMSDSELAAMSASVASRTRELAEAFGLALPVYAVFTKLDRLAGFRPLLEDLGENDRRRTLGVALDEVHEPARVRRTVEQGVVDLVRRIELWTHGEMQRERNLSRSAQMMAAPSQLLALAPRMANVVERLAIDSAEGRLMRLRGLYLLSSVQEGSLLDRVATELGNAFGMADGPLAEASGGSRATFVEGVFRDVVLPESRLAGMDVAAVRRGVLVRGAIAAAVVTMGALAALLLSGSFVRNRALATEVSDKADHYVVAARLTAKDSALAPALDRLEALGGVMDSAARFEPSPPWSMRAFLYQGRTLADNAGDVYDQELAAGVGRRLRASLEHALQGDSGDARYSLRVFGWLKTYLMLGEEHAAQRDAAYLKRVSGEIWADELAATPSLRERLDAQLGHMLDRGMHSQGIDEALVERIRQSIGRDQNDLATFVYGIMESQTSIPGGSDLKLDDLLGPAGRNLFGRKSKTPIVVAAFYTQPGATAFVGDLDRRLKAFCDDGWVLGKYMPPCDRVLGKEVRGQIRRQYAQRYMERWDAVLAAVAPRGNAKAQLDSRAGIAQFVRNVSAHIDLPVDAAAGAAAPDAASDPRAEINQHFRRIGDAVRNGELDKLTANLDTIAGTIKLLDADSSAGDVKIGPNGQLSYQDQNRASQLNEAMARVAGLGNPGFAEPMSSWYGDIQRAAEKLISDSRKQNAARTDAALDAVAGKSGQ